MHLVNTSEKNKMKNMFTLKYLSIKELMVWFNPL